MVHDTGTLLATFTLQYLFLSSVPLSRDTTNQPTHRPTNQANKNAPPSFLPPFLPSFPLALTPEPSGITETTGCGGKQQQDKTHTGTRVGYRQDRQCGGKEKKKRERERSKRIIDRYLKLTSVAVPLIALFFPFFSFSLFFFFLFFFSFLLLFFSRMVCSGRDCAIGRLGLVGNYS